MATILPSGTAIPTLTCLVHKETSGSHLLAAKVDAGDAGSGVGRVRDAEVRFEEDGERSRTNSVAFRLPQETDRQSIGCSRSILRV